MAEDHATYRGSPKHKNCPARGRKGTLCPEWTHATPVGGLGVDPFGHNWAATDAHRLFMASEYDPEGSGKRYATARGVAFVAQPSADGSWHGYPEPWHKVPSELKDKWLAAKIVSTRDLKHYSDFPQRNINWALESDDD
jgi:hypothetical protein